jgi:hypothetical protein
MMLLGLLGTLVGMVLGMYYRVFILFPVTALAWAALAAGGLVLNDGVLPVAASMLLVGAALQFGFLVGITTRTVVAGARSPGRREPQASRQPTAQ